MTKIMALITFVGSFLAMIVIGGLMVYLTWPTVFAGPLKVLVTNGWMPSSITLTEAVCLQFLFGALFKAYLYNDKSK